MHISDAKRLTTEGARKIKNAAVKAAEKAGIAVTVAVVDGGGHLLVLERMDGGKFHTVHSATTKAVCAASNKRNTGSTGAVGQSLDIAHALGLALAAGPERWTAMEGGVPVMVGGECIGGVGVAGGNWEFDEKVAREAAAAIAAPEK
jgi:glc operon protein GlcG